MVKPHQMHDRRVKIVDMNGVLSCSKTKIIRRAMDEPAFHPTASHENGKCEVIVIPTVVDGQSSTIFEHGRPSKFSSYNDQGVFQKALNFSPG